MNKILAQGTRWELSHETFPHAPDRLYLRLISEYGTVEITPTTGGVLDNLMLKIEQEYNKLKALGPILPKQEQAE